MSNSSQYIIEPNDWTENYYYDETTGCGFWIKLEQDKCRWTGRKGYNILGSTYSLLDEENVYFYDLAQPKFTCSPYPAIISCDVDENNIPTENLVIPQWFIEHCQKLHDLEEELDEIMCDFMKSIGKSDEVYDVADEEKALEYFGSIGKSKWDLYDAAYVYNHYR